MHDEATGTRWRRRAVLCTSVEDTSCASDRKIRGGRAREADVPLPCNPRRNGEGDRGRKSAERFCPHRAHKARRATAEQRKERSTRVRRIRVRQSRGAAPGDGHPQTHRRRCCERAVTEESSPSRSFAVERRSESDLSARNAPRIPRQTRARLVTAPARREQTKRAERHAHTRERLHPTRAP